MDCFRRTDNQLMIVTINLEDSQEKIFSLIIKFNRMAHSSHLETYKINNLQSQIYKTHNFKVKQINYHKDLKINMNNIILLVKYSIKKNLIIQLLIN